MEDGDPLALLKGAFRGQGVHWTNTLLNSTLMTLRHCSREAFVEKATRAESTVGIDPVDPLALLKQVFSGQVGYEPKKP